jgi:hypothetical protein
LVDIFCFIGGKLERKLVNFGILCCGKVTTDLINFSLNVKMLRLAGTPSTKRIFSKCTEMNIKVP